MARGRVSVDITADASGVARGTKDAERHLDRLNRAGSRSLGRLKAAGAAAGIAVGVAMAAQFTKAVRAASDLDEAINKNNQTFEGAAAATEEWANTTARSMGLSKSAALEGASSIGAMLKPMGVAPKTAAEMSRSMVQLAGDMASFNNEDPSEMLDRIRAGLSGESEPLKRYGTVLSETRVQQHAWTEGIAESGVKLTETQKIQARYSLLLKDTSDQQGDFARTSDGLANQQRILSAQWEDVSAKMGTKFLPIVTKVVAALNDLIVWAERNWPKWERALRKAWDDAEPTLREIQATMQSVIRFVQRLWDAFGDDILRVLRVVGRGLANLARIIGDVFQLIGALIRGDWAEVWENLQQIVEGVLDHLLTLFIRLPAAYGRLWLKVGQAIVTGILDGMAALGDKLDAELRKAVRKGFAAARAEASRQAGSLIDSAADFARDPGGSLADRLGFATGGIVPGGGGRAVPIIAHAGEVVLNPGQQRIVGIDRIMGALRATGGVIGGDGAAFASGGYVQPFPGGRWAGGPDAHASRALGNWQSDNAWDIMGGGNVYAVLPGRIGRVSPDPGTGPGFAGAAVYLHTADGTWWYKHLGSVAVRPGQHVDGGDLIGNTSGTGVNGGDHLHLATDRGNPNRAQRGASPARAGGSPSEGNATREELSAGTVRREKGGAIRAAKRILATPISGGESISGAASSAVTEAGRGDSLAEKEARVRGEDAAVAAGITNPSKIRAIGEQEVLDRRRKQIQRDARIVHQAAKKVHAAIQRMRRHRKKLYTALRKVKVGKNPARARARIRRLREGIEQTTNRLRDLFQEMNGLIEEGAQLQAEAAELDFDIGQLAKEIAALPNLDGAETAAETAGTATEPQTVVDPDVEAAREQAELNAETSAREARLAGGFLRTIAGASSIDPASGAVTINIQTLHPGDPSIQLELANWITGALGGQGSIPATTLGSAT